MTYITEIEYDYVKIDKNQLRNVGKGMNLKNLLLSIFAVILTICLIGLIFLATNQNALAKVHQTICTFSKANKLSVIEKTTQITDFKTAKASEKNDNNNNNDVKHQKTTYVKKDNHRLSETDFTPRERKVIAINYANKHLDEQYDLKQVNQQQQDSKYLYVNQQKNQQTNISVNGNGQVGANHSDIQ